MKWSRYCTEELLHALVATKGVKVLLVTPLFLQIIALPLGRTLIEGDQMQ